MTIDQCQRYTQFLTHFVSQLFKSTDLTQEQATMTAELAVCVWLATEAVQSGNKTTETFVVGVLQSTLALYYPRDREPVPDAFRRAFENEE